MMKRNCNLELRLLPPSISQDYDVVQQLPIYDVVQQQPQQLTIFYDGKVVSSDVTEVQARAIILLASQERTKTRTRSISSPSSPLVQKQLYNPTALSMKRSLQRFLQKRKNRVQATSPYHR